jgi:hypothetical protein
MSALPHHYDLAPTSTSTTWTIYSIVPHWFFVLDTVIYFLMTAAVIPLFSWHALRSVKIRRLHLDQKLTHGFLVCFHAFSMLGLLALFCSNLWNAGCNILHYVTQAPSGLCSTTEARAILVETQAVHQFCRGSVVCFIGYYSVKELCFVRGGQAAWDRVKFYLNILIGVLVLLQFGWFLNISNLQWLSICNWASSLLVNFVCLTQVSLLVYRVRTASIVLPVCSTRFLLSIVILYTLVEAGSTITRIIGVDSVFTEQGITPTSTFLALSAMDLVCAYGWAYCFRRAPEIGKAQVLHACFS